MEQDAYKLGSLDAVLELGLTKEAWGKAVMPILGSLAGAALAPEGERAQGAMLGGLGALGLQSAAFGPGKAAPVVAATHTPSPAPSGHSMQDVGHAVFEQGKGQLKQWLNAPAGGAKPVLPAAPAAPQLPPPAGGVPTPGGKSWAQTRQAKQDLEERVQKMKRREYLPKADPQGEPAKIHKYREEFLRQPAPAASAAPGMMDPATMEAFRREMGLTKKSSLNQFKLAIDLGGSIGIPGMGGLGVTLKDQQERLPGMSKWVPRGAVERGFEYLDQGFDPESVMDTEAERGSLLHPATGAALAAMGAAKFAPKSGVGGALLAGLGGAGLGSLYHRATNEQRRGEGLEAYEGARREREKFPIRRHATQTANEASPLAVSRGHGDA